jgi:hypothetical protein
MPQYKTLVPNKLIFKCGANYVSIKRPTALDGSIKLLLNKLKVRRQYTSQPPLWELQILQIKTKFERKYTAPYPNISSSFLIDFLSLFLHVGYFTLSYFLLSVSYLCLFIPFFLVDFLSLFLHQCLVHSLFFFLSFPIFLFLFHSFFFVDFLSLFLILGLFYYNIRNALNCGNIEINN